LNRCWLNYGQQIFFGTVAPVGALAATAIVLADAAGTSRREPLPTMDKMKYKSAL
jgi:hypothetical protein